ncbi:MAG: histidinol-phosphate transaminase [Casimicrobiaceae bacterium]
MNALQPPVAEISATAVAARVAATIRPDVRALNAYAVAKAHGAIKLDAMENPYDLPTSVHAELAAALVRVPLNRYPDGPGDSVKQALARSLGLPNDVGLILGNGSDEILQIVTTAVCGREAVVLAPDPSFVMYRLNALYAKARFVGVSLRPDFTLDVSEMLAAIERERPALVWIAYPNNPTGNLFPAAEVERIIAAAPGLVVVDEAYYAFAEHSFLPRVLEYANLVVVRTVSKIGMAGLRLGYAAAHPAWIAEFEKVRPPYNVNALTQAALPVLLSHEATLARQAQDIRAERVRLSGVLARIQGVTTYPTQANFVLARVPDANGWFVALRAAGILVKNLHGTHPLLAQCLRITVGTPAENDRLLAAVSSLS